MVIYKQFTSVRGRSGPVQSFSADPDEFSTLVRSVRRCERMLGSGEKKPVQEEIPFRTSARRCLVAAKDIAKKELFTEANVGLKRPRAEQGLPTDLYYQILGVDVPHACSCLSYVKHVALNTVDRFSRR